VDGVDDRFRPTWQKIKRIPPELVPLAIVMVLGLGGTQSNLIEHCSDEIAAGFSMAYKLASDPTVRNPFFPD
jgi:hypothetical protein